jgi:arylformamidase
MNEAWIDVTVPVRSGMVHFPGDPPIEVTRVLELSKGDPATVSRLSLGVHSGTHVDAPVHFIADGYGIDSIPLDDLIGPARVVATRDPRVIDVPALRALEPRAGERLLFKTRNSNFWSQDEFAADYVYLSLEGARFLVERGVRTVGIDYLSIAGTHESAPTHTTLLRAGVCIIEALDLRAIEPGPYEMICLPLRLAGADGAPARVALRRHS